MIKNLISLLPHRHCHPCHHHPTVPHHHHPHCCSIILTIVVICCSCGLAYCAGDGVVVGSCALCWHCSGLAVAALHSVLGWRHGGACAWWVGGVGVLHSVLRWCHSGACAWWVGVMVGLACHVGMTSQWGLHVAS